MQEEHRKAIRKPSYGNPAKGFGGTSVPLWNGGIKMNDEITEDDIFEYETCLFDTCLVCAHNKRYKCRLISEMKRANKALTK